MNKPWVVLLVKLKDQDVEPFSVGEAEQRFTGAGRGTGNLVDYFLDMSHGRFDLSETRVAGWLESSHSFAERGELYDRYRKEDEKNGTQRANTLIRNDEAAWGREAATAAGIDLSVYAGIVTIYSGAVDYFGQVGQAVLSFNAADPSVCSIDLTGVAHEWAHALGLGHSRQEGNGNDYADPWDIMSAYGVRSVPGGRYDRVGPGMNAANMAIAGWLDETRVWTPPADGEYFVTLRPLHRRDLDGYLAARVGEVYVELRMNEGWDAGFEGPMVLLHRKGLQPNSLERCSYLLGRASLQRPFLQEGDSHDDLGGRFGPKPSLEVLRIDPEAREATLLIRAGQRRGPLDGFEFVSRFLGPIVGDGGLLFHPRKGPSRVPPRGPLLRVAESLAAIESLAGLDLDLATHRQAMRGQLTRMRDEIAGMLAALDEPRVPRP